MVGHKDTPDLCPSLFLEADSLVLIRHSKPSAGVPCPEDCPPARNLHSKVYYVTEDLLGNEVPFRGDVSIQGVLAHS